MQLYSLIIHPLQGDIIREDYVSDQSLSFNDLIARLNPRFLSDHRANLICSIQTENGYLSEQNQTQTPNQHIQATSYNQYIRSRQSQSAIPRYEGNTHIHLREPNRNEIPRRITLSHGSEIFKKTILSAFQHHLKRYTLHIEQDIINNKIDSCQTHDRIDDEQLAQKINERLRRNTSKKIIITTTPHIETRPNPITLYEHNNTFFIKIQGHPKTLIQTILHQDLTSIKDTLSTILHTNPRQAPRTQTQESYQALCNASTPVIDRYIGTPTAQPTQHGATQVLHEIAHHRKIMDFSINAHTLYAVTSILGTTQKAFGAYIVTMKKKDTPYETARSLKLKNLTRRIHGNHHPHQRSTTCLGNASPMIVSALEQNSPSTALTIALNYATDANENDQWGQSIREYPNWNSLEAYQGDRPTESLNHTNPRHNTDDQDTTDDDLE